MNTQKQGIYECEQCNKKCGTLYGMNGKWVCGDCAFLFE